MQYFERQFDVRVLERHREHPVIKALFERWMLPGENAGTHGLRLAVRNGYLNFYVKGQSVAKLSMRAASPRIEVHDKYVAGVAKGQADEKEYGQKYTSFILGLDCEPDGIAVEKWARAAETYAGDEKRFVDDLVAVTAGTLDLEMALPAREDAADRSAPRMDLVVAQGQAVAFWEAKCAVNGELRSDHDRLAPPHVVIQLRKYMTWVNHAGGMSEVRSAYLKTANILLALAEMFGKHGPAIAAWRTFASAGEEVAVILPPGIVVGNYCPFRADGKSRGKEARRYESHAASFVANSHAARLARFGIELANIPGKPAASCLPILMSGQIAAMELRP